MKQIVVNEPVVGEWIARRSGVLCPISTQTPTIALVEDGKILAGVLYEGFNRANINMHVAAEGSRWLNRTFLWICFDYPFNQLGVTRVTGLVPSDNLEARHFDEHLGFKLEATLKDAYPGADLLVYSMRHDECRWLKLKDRNHVNARVERPSAESFPADAGRSQPIVLPESGYSH